MLREASLGSLSALITAEEPRSPTPRRIAGIHSLPLENELVLRHPDGSVVVLDRTGALIWSCLDGESDVASAIDDLVFVTGAPPDVVAADVETLVAELSYRGFLRGTGALARSWRLRQEMTNGVVDGSIEPSDVKPSEPDPDTPELIGPDILAATIAEGEQRRADAIAAGLWPVDENGEPLPLRTVTQTFEWSSEEEDQDDDAIVFDSAGMASPAGIPTFVPSVPPQSCLGRKLHLDSPGTVLRVPCGPDAVRVRCGPPALEKWLIDELGAVPISSTDAISLHVVEGGAHLGRPVVRLLEGSASSVARGDEARVRQALWGWLRWSSLTSPTAVHLAVDAVIVEGGVVLVDRRLTASPAAQTRLARNGHPMLDQPASAIDPLTGHLEALRAWPDQSTEHQPVRAVIGVREPVEADRSAGDQVLTAGWLCARLSMENDPSTGLDAVGAIVRAAQCILLDEAGHAELVDAVTAVSRAEGVA